MDSSRLLVAGDLTAWLAGLVVGVAYTRRRMRIPKSLYARNLWVSGWYRAIAGLLLFAVAALALTVYGIANVIGGNRGEGGAALALGAIAWFMTIVMGLFASPLVLGRLRR